MAKAKKQEKDSAESLKKRVKLLSRELEIEAALEKVRSRAMSMRSSDMLAETSAVMFKQIQALGIDATRCGVGIFDEAHDAMEVWLTTASAGDKVMRVLDYVNLHIHPVYENILAARKKKKPYAITVLKGEEVRNYYNTMSAYMAGTARKVVNKEEAYQSFFFDQGTINITTANPLSEEERSIMVRFAKVFGLIYLRFVDLQKAEAQANEAKVEASLERVRSRSLAMRKSNELSEVAVILYQELRSLGVTNFFNCGFIEVDTEANIQHGWMTRPGGKKIEGFPLPLVGDAVLQERFEAWQRREPVFYQSIGGTELKKHLEFVTPTIGSKKVDRTITKNFPDPTVFYSFNFSHGYLHIITNSLLNADEEVLATRFTRVFEIAYQRFLDLKIAEAQAREAQVEAALERIRSRSMAMQRSEEMPDVIGTVMDQFHQLGFAVDLANFNFPSRSRDWTMWLARPGYAYPELIRLPYLDHVLFNNPREAVKKGMDSLSDVLSGKAALEAMHHFLTTSIVGNDPPKVIARIKKAKGLARSMVFGKHIALTISNYEGIPYTEEQNAILRRFHGVFEQSYTRFLDLQKAEAQTREAQIELSLERVRARTMAMHQSAELVETSAVLFHELKSLGVAAIRTGVAVFDRNKETMELWSSQLLEQKQNPILGVVPVNLHPFFSKLFQAWILGESDFTYTLSGDEVKEYYQKTSSKLSYPRQSQYNAREVFNPFFFPEGSLTVVAHEPLNPEERNIMRRFATVFGLLYRRFLDLQKAEAQAREAQIEAALERVRAKTMAMHKSEQLPETAQVLFEQFAVLGSLPDRISIGIIREQDKVIEWWATDQQGSQLARKFKSTTEQKAHHAWFEAWRQKKESLVIEMTGNDLKEWVRFVRETVNMPMDDSQVKGRRVHHAAFFTHGLLLFSTHEPLPQETLDLLIRFAKVFDQTYTRFLDLQKAEAQAREAQIEAALERVRSRSMAMHKSEELKEVIQVVFEQLSQLNLKIDSANFQLDYKESDDWKLWTGTPGNLYPRLFEIPYFDHPIFNSLKKAKEEQIEFLADTYAFDEKNVMWKHFFKHAPWVTEERQQYILDSPGFARSQVFMTNISLFILNYQGIPYSEADNDIIKRFARVFEQTYTRFLDLQKAEAQAREAEIQLALERVRAKTMAMHKSDELPQAANLLFQQVQALGMPAWSAGYCIWDEDKQGITLWMSSEGVMQEAFHAPLTEDPSFIHMREAYERGDAMHVEEVGGKALVEHYRYMRTLPVVGEILDSIIAAGHPLPTFQIFHCVYFSKGFLLFITYEPVPQAHDLFMRFGKVFDQTYTRFLDLKRAEAQAREAQIEAALERVRSKTMAMHNSADVGESVATLFDELLTLGALTADDRCGIGIMKPDERMEAWTAAKAAEGKAELTIGYLNMAVHPLLKSAYDGWKNRKETNQYLLKADDKVSYHEAIRNQADYKIKQDYFSDYDQIVHTDFFFDEGCLYVFSLNELTTEASSIFTRFTTVFGQTYRRYLDLQKAEAQAREARLETALERVRSRSLAMHKSTEIQDVVAVVFTQLQQLGLDFEVIGIATRVEHTNELLFWIGNDQHSYANRFLLPYTNFGAGRDILAAMDDKVPFFSKVYAFEEKNRFWSYAFANSGFKALPDSRKEYILESPSFSLSVAPVNGVLLLLIDYSGKVATEQESELVKRFARVFEQCYVRFQDLEKVEAQAREANIQASLERVRSKAMAMHNSEDLSVTVDSFFSELRSLGVTPRRCGVTLIDKETRIADLTATTATQDGESRKITGKLRLAGHPVLDEVYSHWNLQKEYHPVLRGREIGEYYGVMSPQVAFPEFAADDIQYGHYFFFTEGGVYAWTEKEIPDEALTIYRRFTSVLSLTYKRYKDLKDAEARAKEAVKQASLDRVRAEIASMRNADDLQRITPLIWRELTTLGVPFFRCGVMIVHEKEHHVDFYLSTPEGKPLAALHLDSNGQEVTKRAMDHWRRQAVYTDHWDREQFAAFAQSMVKDGQIQNTSAYQGGELPPASLTLQFSPFAQGMLYVGTEEPLSAEQLELVHALADAFSTAYARYEDFTRLEAAKATVEKALSELRTTQNQLVQSEKMASLGELTAGIAHEIQNPLNFVNNFSEVSKELLEEMEAELKNGNQQDALQIAKDIIQNLEKINFHGKRADGIVKSMLQHSRKSTGQKELTDINALCDEYLRLAYHGLRAKDKSFNAKFETDFDPSVGQISVLPQEIGRVILNLINNAFYAVSEKKKMNVNGYEPTVTVSTRKLGNTIEIRVRDNGTGIPQKALDKIFNPFFTTKPTGQGTGLGLSLSYDIVKAHGGELSVETKEGEGSVFIIQLPS